jgi:hypothetical protein
MSPSGKPPSSGHEVDENSIAVIRLPTCEYCLDRSEFVGETGYGGRKVYMCARHFKQHGRGLGSGRGFRLVLVPEDAGQP